MEVRVDVVAVPKILLFYVFTPLADPDAIRLWQRDLCESLGLKGRILISKDGINGTVGGELNAVKKYVRKTKQYPAFKNIDFKWSEGRADDFPRLSVRVRDEIVSFGAPGELRVDSNGVIGGGTKLTPEQLHELVERKRLDAKDVTFFDGRNRFEAAIGRFADAVVPAVDNTREFVAELDRGTYDHLKNQPVVTYCTGGIRCEVLSSLMVNRGFTEVYQLDGGIVRYGETFGDRGLWNGSLYVFDERKSLEFSDDAAVIGHCSVCATATSRMENCGDPACRAQLVVCDEHAASIHCTEHAAA
ncbi:MAG: hypothetical protein QOI14_269 [Actinomycetota bacterium]|nr:hypothetical protein [Actinomycetota bacterium]